MKRSEMLKVVSDYLLENNANTRHKSVATQAYEILFEIEKAGMQPPQSIFNNKVSDGPGAIHYYANKWEEE